MHVLSAGIVFAIIFEVPEPLEKEIFFEKKGHEMNIEFWDCWAGVQEDGRHSRAVHPEDFLKDFSVEDFRAYYDVIGPT